MYFSCDCRKLRIMLSKEVKYLIGYSLFSLVLLGITISNALYNSNNYFTFLFELTDGFSLGVLLNTLSFIFVVISKLLQLLMFGELRILESEHVIERLPLYIINSLLTLTTKDTNIVLNVFLLCILVLSKTMHSVLVDRLDFTQMQISTTFSNQSSYTRSEVLLTYGQCRYIYLNLIFIVLDFFIAKLLVYDVFQGINSVTCLLFGLQFAIQGLECLAIFLKHSLTIYELAAYPKDNDNLELDDDDDELVWEYKGIYTKSIEIIESVLKVTAFLAFTYLLSLRARLSIPLSMFQGTYSAVRQTYLAIKGLRQFLDSSKRLDSQLQDATAEDLAHDNLCIVCREDMVTRESLESNGKKFVGRRKPKKLSCGHILHMGCLKDWLERSDNCPLCRRKVFATKSEETPNAEASNQETPNMEVVNEEHVPDVRRDDINQLIEPRRPVTRFSEFDALIRQYRNQQAGPVSELDNHLSAGEVITVTEDPSIIPVPTPTTSNPDFDDGYQHINLPNTALIPPNWTLLPLSNQNGYRVHLSTRLAARLTVRRKPQSRELHTINPHLAS